MASPRFEALMKARRAFNGVPIPDSWVPAFKEVWGDNVRGMYSDDMQKAYWYAGDRPTRRHEVMHGIRAAASRDPSLSAAIPWWARGERVGGFRDELLARLASKDRSQITDWPTGEYPSKSAIDIPLYGAFDVGRFAAKNPVLVASGLTGLGTLAYGLSLPEKEAGAQEQNQPASGPHSLDSIIERLGQ